MRQERISRLPQSPFASAWEETMKKRETLKSNRERTSNATGFGISDELWAVLQPMLPVPVNTHRSGGGRPRVPDRDCANAIFYVLKTGRGWQALDEMELCPRSTAHDRFQEWVQAGVFLKLRQTGPQQLEELQGMNWGRIFRERARTKAPWGTSTSATDREKGGGKRRRLASKDGEPIGLVIEEANRQQMKRVQPIRNGIVSELAPLIRAEQPSSMSQAPGNGTDSAGKTHHELDRPVRIREKQTVRTRPWEVSDTLWERVQPHIPERKSRAKGGRPPEDDRKMFTAIVYVLRTGIQWNALPRERGASTTVYDRFRLWESQGFFRRLWQSGLQEFDELVGLDWEWQSMDGVMTKAPLGGEATGPNPTDRGKSGTKRSELSEGHGLPLAIAINGANAHDSRLADPTLDGIVIARPEPSPLHPQNLCLDAAYIGEKIEQVVKQYQYIAHVRGRSEESAQARSADPSKKPRRWVVERLHSWLNRSRRILVRWEKLTETYEAFLHLACALLCFQQCDRAQAVLQVDMANELLAA
jgi:putative transposase